MSDPDSSGLAPLEEQRDFLLRSLEDLEREHDAGDLDEADYLALKDDYTARAAAVLRSLAGRPGGSRRGRATPIGRRVAAILGVVAFAGLAGLLVAQASGRRDPGDLSSGTSDQSVTEKLNEAGQLLSDGDAAGAVELYDEVLAGPARQRRGPHLRGWALYQFLGEPEDGAQLAARRRHGGPRVPRPPRLPRRPVLPQRPDRAGRATSWTASKPSIRRPTMLELTAGLRDEIDAVLAAAAASTTTTTP